VNIPDRQQIDAELSRLIALRTEFFQKGNPMATEIQEFEQAGKRIRNSSTSLRSLVMPYR
jgi:hypothetical protein